MGKKKSKGFKSPAYESKFDPSTEKTAKIVKDPTDFYETKPAWRITNLEMVEPFGWHAIDFETIQKIQARLVSLETMTWRDILIDGKKRNHPIPLTSLCKKAQKRLVDLKLDDHDEIYSIGVGAKERVFGFRENHILSLLWWDPFHQVCPSHKKGS